MSAQPSRPSSPLPEAKRRTVHMLRLGFGVVIVLIVFISSWGIVRLHDVYHAFDEVGESEQAAIEQLFRMQLAARDRTFSLIKIVHAGDAFERDAEMRRFYDLGAVFGEARVSLLTMNLSKAEYDLLEQQRQQTAKVISLQEKIIELAASGKRHQAEMLLIEQAIPTQQIVIDHLTTLLNRGIQDTQDHAQQIRQAHKQTGLLMMMAGIGGVVLATLIAIFVMRRMSRLVAGLAETNTSLNESIRDLEFLKKAVDAHNIVSVADVYGSITYVNEQFCQVSQYTQDELIGRNHRMLKSGVHPDVVYAEMWETISAGRIWHGDLCNRRKDGSFYWVASTIVPFVGDDGLPYQYISVRTDITQIKEAQRILERSQAELEREVRARTHDLIEREEVMRSITNAAQDAVMMIDHLGQVTYWNPAATHMFGYTREEVIGRNLHDLIVPDRYIERHRAAFAHFATAGQGPLIGRTAELEAKRKDGVEFPVEIALSAVKLHGQWSAVGIVRDATERKQIETRLKELATTDTLTGICNRRRFDEVIANETDRAARFGAPLSVILFDIDHFKRVNDTYGHQVGDRVLIQLALTVSNSIRATDLFARWGGEEFVILAPNCDISSARLLGEKLRMAVENQHFADVERVTCSFGIADYMPGDTAETLVQKADRCLYFAKQSGRNRVETSATLPEQSLRV